MKTKEWQILKYNYSEEQNHVSVFNYQHSIVLYPIEMYLSYKTRIEENTRLTKSLKDLHSCLQMSTFQFLELDWEEQPWKAITIFGLISLQRVPLNHFFHLFSSCLKLQGKMGKDKKIFGEIKKNYKIIYKKMVEK